MKKTMLMILVGVFVWNLSFASAGISSSESVVLSGLITQLQTNIKAQPELLDHYLSVMQKMAKAQESDLQSALQENNKEKVAYLTKNWDLMRQVNAFLYAEKEQKSQKKAELRGNVYAFKSQVLMPRLSMTWGGDDYFAFPSKQAYVQLNWNQTITWEVNNLISVDYQGQNYLPKYYYAGAHTLHDVGEKEKGEKIGKSNGKEQESYLFFDLPLKEEKELKNLTFRLWDTVIPGEKLFIQPAFSPIYTSKEMSSAFAFCKAVAEWKGGQSTTKEYPERDCEAAVQLNFSSDLHSDILEYVQHLYWKYKNLPRN